MTKEDLINDINFKEKCAEYGLDCEKAEIYCNVILINTPIEGLYVIFDKNYNTIGIERKTSQNLEQFANDYYEKYSNKGKETNFNKTFEYPFENYTLKDFIDLDNQVEIIESNNGHISCIKVNGRYYDRTSQENEEYFELISYIKFIIEEIKNYFLMSYHLKTMGIEVPEINSYVRLLIKNINASVEYDIGNNQRPLPSNILNSIGQHNKILDFDSLLFDIADLLMKQKGLKVKSDNPNVLETIDSPVSKINLSALSDEILQILNLVENKEQNDDNISKSGPTLKMVKHN